MTEQSLDYTTSYLDKLKSDIGGINTPFEKGFAITTALPFWLADKTVAGIKEIPNILNTLKEVMYKNPNDFDNEEYETKMLDIASAVLGGGLGTSSLIKEEIGGTVLAMNKADALSMWRNKTKNLMSELQQSVNQGTMLPEERFAILKKAEAAYKAMETRLSQREFDEIEFIGPVSLNLGTKGRYKPSKITSPKEEFATTPSIEIDLTQTKEVSDVINTLFHEFTHAGQFGEYAKEELFDDTTALFNYKTASIKKAMELVDKANEINPGEISFSRLQDAIYRRYDPTEAMARKVGAEAAETNLPFEDIYESYLTAFAKKHKEYASYPTEKKGIVLGPDWEKFFTNIYIDRTADRALQELTKKTN